MIALIIGVICELAGPVVLLVAKFIFGADLLDGLAGSHGNTTLQENVVGLGIWITIIGSIVAPFSLVKFLRSRLAPSILMVVGLGAFLLPSVLSVIISGLPT